MPALRGSRRTCTIASRTARSATSLLLRAYRDRSGRLRASPRPSRTASASCCIRSRIPGFLWASGGCFSDFLIHNIDECCWMKDAWPVKAKGARRPALSRRLTSTRTSTPIRSNTRSPTARKMLSKAATGEGCYAGVCQLRPRHQGLGDHLDVSPLARPSCRIYKGQNHDSELAWAFAAARAQPVPGRVGPPDRRRSVRTSRTTRSSAAPRPAWSRRWAAWPPIPARSLRSTRC